MSECVLGAADGQTYLRLYCGAISITLINQGDRNRKKYNYIQYAMMNLRVTFYCLL